MKQKYVLRSLTFVTIAVAAALVGPSVYAHPATEQYIPIGYWSSVGGAHTYVGALTGVSAQSDTLTFNDDGQPREIRITEDTKIWIDLSHLKQSSMKGERSDIKPGVITEVKIKEGSDDEAEWIKIQGSR